MNSRPISNRRFSDFFTQRIGFMQSYAQHMNRLSHKGLRGRFRELLVRELLEYLVPKTCGIVYGTVVDSNGERSKSGSLSKSEDDILIIDRECLPPFFEIENEGIYPVESVLARIEVKSSLDRAAIEDAVAGASMSARLQMNLPLDKGYKGNDAIQVLFAFGSKTTGHTVYENMLNIMKENQERRTDATTPVIQHLCIPGTGYWVFVSSEDYKPGWYHCAPDIGEYSEVLAFIAVLLHELPARREARKKATLGRYIECLRKKRLQPIELPIPRRRRRRG